MKLIDKSALVAEIEKRRKKNARNKLNLAAAFEDNYLLSFIDTLEVKEVDLEKEVNDYGYHYDYVSIADRKELVDFAKHFFELALSLKNN